MIEDRHPRPVPIPHDPEAEQQLVGLVTAELRHAKALGAWLEPDEFYRPAFGRAYDAACQLTVTDLERRTAAVAIAADLPLARIEELVKDRTGSAEPYARRVRAAGRRRRLMGLAAELHSHAPGDDPDRLLEVVAKLEVEARALVEEELALQTVETVNLARPGLAPYRRAAEQ